MLSRKYSLSKKKDIERVFQKGQIYFSSFFNLKFINNNFNYPRFCIIISAKISKKAVVRNKLKRRLRAILYKNLANISKNYDIVILTKPAAVTADYHQLEEKLIYLLKKINHS